jgi:hypothetical protein
MKFSSLSERQILKAQAEGQFDNLAGAGKPLKPRGGGDYAEEAGFRIMAEAGAFPKEVQLRKAVEAQMIVLQSAATASERKDAMSKLADLQMRLAIQEEARRKYYSG